jgi:hypothetical protein
MVAYEKEHQQIKYNEIQAKHNTIQLWSVIRLSTTLYGGLDKEVKGDFYLVESCLVVMS